jgi:type I restriction enzyme, S subunit
MPNGWKTVKLMDLAAPGRAIISGPFGSNIGKRFFVNSGVPIIRGNNLTKGKRKFVDAGFVFVSRDKAEELNTFAVQGDIIYTAAGTIGQVGIIPSNANYGEYVISNKQIRVRLDPQKILSSYAYAILSSDRMIRAVERQNTGSTIPLINLSIIKSLVIQLPPLAVQSKIMDILNSWDTHIDLLDKKIELKRSIKKGLLQKLFLGEIRLPGFSKEWKNVELADILQYEQPTKYIVGSDEYSNDHTTPVLTANKSFILGYTNETHGIYSNTPVIIFDDFTVDNKYVDFNFKVKSSAIKLLKPSSKDINLRFVYERMQFFPYTSAEHKRNYISEYQHLDLKLPPIEEQNAIAKLAETAEKEITGLVAKRSSVLNQKKYLLNKLATNEISLSKSSRVVQKEGIHA